MKAAEGNLLFDYGNSVTKIMDNSDINKRIEKARLIIDTMKRLGYKAINVGEAELFIGPSKLNKMTSDKISTLSSNIYSIKNKKRAFKSHIVFEQSGYRFLVTGVFPSNYPPMLKNKLKKYALEIKDPQSEIRKILKDNTSKYDFSIILSSMSAKDNSDLSGSVTGIDFILGAKGYSRNTANGHPGDTLMFWNLPKGAAVSILELDIHNKGSFTDLSRISSLSRSLENLKRQKTRLKASSMKKDRKNKVLDKYNGRISSLKKEIEVIKKEEKGASSNTAFQRQVRLDAAVSDDPNTRKALNALYGKKGKSI